MEDRGPHGCRLAGVAFLLLPSCRCSQLSLLSALSSPRHRVEEAPSISLCSSTASIPAPPEASKQAIQASASPSPLLNQAAAN
ncbi:hypothetical protein SEVIR_3G123250v4 [Setaria viridis]|uniref:Uncharacterized protein n=1 Tax=Setaria viridis TaxID=4556 RepID=A0A4V6D9D1_SETVI|nr:hypothetical protein SEVIR_3G123250v2 [Setaria viridis]